MSAQRISILLACFISSTALFAIKNNHIICIENPDTPVAKKEAVLILPGLGDGRKQRKQQETFFCGRGYDVFIPDYIDKDGFEATYQRFEDFYDHFQLGEYEKLHIFSYILGSWTINTFIKQNGAGNIHSIVYDRSPMQELAPELIVENIPRIAKVLFGKLPEDLTNMPYPSIDTSGISIGIIVESKATPILRFYEKKAKQKRDFNWGEINYHQAHHDLMYTYLNHDEMYLQLHAFGNEVFSFFEEGSFEINTRRHWYGWDSFRKLPKLKKKAYKDSSLRGSWQSQTFYAPRIEDSVQNYLGLNRDGYLRFNSDTNAMLQIDNNQTPVRIDRKKTLLQWNSDGDIYPIQQLPQTDRSGKWFLILDGRKYWKVKE